MRQTRTSKRIRSALLITVISIIVGLLILGATPALAYVGKNQVRTSSIVNGAVTTSKLADNAVTSAKIRTGAVKNSDLANNIISTVKLRDNCVTSEKIKTGAVKNSDLANNIITQVKIVDGAVVNSKLGANAVTTDKIAAGAVGTTDIADGAVTSSKIDTDAVTTDKIAAGAVGTTDIADTAVTNAKLAADISVLRLGFGYSGGDRIITDTMSFDTSYATGGEVVSIDSTLGVIRSVMIVPSNGGYVFELDETSFSAGMFKVKALQTGDTTGAPLSEVPGGTNLSAITGIRFEAIGSAP